MARSTLDFAQQNTERAVQATNPLLTVYWRWPGMPLVVLTGKRAPFASSR
jgi:hypothetical protein